jgi:cysteine synthase A
MPELMLIGIGKMGRPYLAAARRLGLRIHAIEAESRADAVRDDVDSLHTSRGDLDELWAEAVWAAADESKPTGIAAFTEWNVLGAALLADRLDLPGPSLHAAVISRDKALQRGLFSVAGVQQPEYLAVPALAGAREWVAGRFPVVVKPLSSAGSMGVELVAGAAEFEAACARRTDGPLLAETAIEGPEYSWEAFVENGQVWLSHITAKETTGPPYFVEVSHRGGVRFTGDTARQVDRMTAAVLAAMGMRTGIVHLEFRLAECGPVLMEVAVRTPGDYIMELVGLTYGIDAFETVLRLAMGMPLPEPPSAPVASAATYLPQAPCGEVISADGLAEVLAHPHVVDAGLWVAPGEQVPAHPSGSGRIGYVVLAAPDPAPLEEAMAFARATLQVRTR